PPRRRRVAPNHGNGGRGRFPRSIRTRGSVRGTAVRRLVAFSVFLGIISQVRRYFDGLSWPMEASTMPNYLAHFDIAADDVERARRFYERVFGWKIEAWGPPDFYLIFTDADKPHGSISKRHEPAQKGGRNGWECTISVDNLDAIKAAIIKHGGKILHGEEEVVGVGTLVHFAETEGNGACAMHYVAGRE